MLVVTWEGGKGGRIMRWQGGKGGRVVKWEGGRFLVLFLMLVKGMKGRSDVNQGNEGDRFKIFLSACRDGKTLLRSSASC